MKRVLSKRLPGERSGADADRRGRRPCGFTLMETLVALGLCGMIVASIGSSIDLYWKYRKLSRDRVVNSQVLRGIMEDLTSDLRSATAVNVIPSAESIELPSDIPSALTSSGVPAGLERTLRVQEQQLNLQSDTGMPIHFFGSKTSLAILAEHDSPRFSQQTGHYKMTQQQHFVWWLNDGRSIRMPLSRVGPQSISVTFSAPNLSVGLVRAVHRTGSQKSLVNSGTTFPQMISDSVMSLQFRYFDGSQWLSEWDSSRQFAIPEAVEASVIFKDRSQQTRSFVVSIPQGW